MQLNNEQRETLKKFYDDPDWILVENMVRSYIEPLKDIQAIETEGRTSDEVFAELRGRQTVCRQLESFLAEAGILKSQEGHEPTTFR